MIGFDSNIETFTANIRARGAALANLEPVLTKAAKLVVSETKRRFTDNDWAANAASTIRRKGSSRPGIDTGHLWQSIVASDVTGNSVEIGTNVTYAAYLQFGTQSHERGTPFTTKQGPRARAYSGGTPARPYLYFDQPLKDKILAVFRKAIGPTNAAGGD